MKTARPIYLYNGNSYIGKTTSTYWERRSQESLPTKGLFQIRAVFDDYIHCWNWIVIEVRIWMSN